MFDDSQMIIGLAFLAILLMVIIVFLASKVFEDEPYFRFGLIVGEISFIMLVIVNPGWLRLISYIFASMIIALTFFSSLILTRQTLVVGLPSIGLFIYSFLWGRGDLWVSLLISLIFALGLIASLREAQPVFEMLGKSFPIFAFSLTIVGVFLIPAVFPQMDLFEGIAEIAGTTAGLILYVYIRTQD